MEPLIVLDQRLVATLEVGDDVVTGGGIYGRITRVHGEEVQLEVAPGVELRMARAAVLRRVGETADVRPADGEEAST
jgi:preprotein translocase subunit YajC